MIEYDAIVLAGGRGSRLGGTRKPDLTMAGRRLVEGHAALAATLEKATEKAEQVTRDEHEKGLPYRSDPLFMYLWQRKMGTPEYQPMGIIRMLDEWVARGW